MTHDYADASQWRGTTILSVRKNGKVVVVGDGQVSAGNTVMKSGARKVRTLVGGKVITGFAGATADAFALLERLETKLEQYPTQLARACVELAKDWRTDKYLRQLQAMMIVADKKETFVLRCGGTRQTRIRFWYHSDWVGRKFCAGRSTGHGRLRKGRRDLGS